MLHTSSYLSIFLGILFSLSLNAATETDNAILCKEAETLFEAGNQLAGTNRAEAIVKWQQAATRLETAISTRGLANGPIFYNLGNIYWQMGNVGRAILNYKRAMLYTPYDPNLQKNLDFARKSCQDAIPIQEQTRILKTLFFWQYDISLLWREKIFLLFFILFWLLAIIRLWLRKKMLSWGLGISAFFTILFAISVAITTFSFTHHREGVILMKEIIARTGDGENYGKAFETPLHEGTEFTLINQRSEWLQIRLANGQTAWLPQKAVELL